MAGPAREALSSLSHAGGQIVYLIVFYLLAYLVHGGLMLAGVAGAVVAVWLAAKVFRFGLLMHGKPPNFATPISRVMMRTLRESEDGPCARCSMRSCGS